MKKLMGFALVMVIALAAFAVLLPQGTASASMDREYHFSGKIQALPQGGLTGDWKIGKRTVHVSAATLIDQSNGAAVKGARVQVDGLKEKNGSVDALSIDVLGPDRSPR